MKKLLALPFKISIQDANKILLKRKSFLEGNIIENKGLQLYNGEYVKKTYVPFHSIDIRNLYTSYVGKYGITKYRTEFYFDFNSKSLKTRQVAYTDWHKCQGQIKTKYEFGTTFTQIYAGLKYSNKLIEKCVSFSTKDRKKFIDLDKIENDIEIEPHEMKIGFAIEKIIDRINDNEKHRVHSHIIETYDADDSDINNMSVNIENADVKLISYYMPAYIHCIKNGDHECHNIVNGYDGMVMGTRIFSATKLYTLGAIIGTAISLHPIFVPLLGPSIILRMVIGNMALGGSFGLFGKFYSKIKSFLYKREIEENIKENMKYNATDEDIQRIKFADKNEKGNTTHSIKFVDEKIKSMLTLLNIDYNDKNINCDMIKKKYHVEIKKYHPDHYKGDGDFGNNMTQQINDAYKELINYYKK